jgi:uncharacterized protein YaaQ
VSVVNEFAVRPEPSAANDQDLILVVAIVQDDDASGLVDELVRQGFSVTRLASAGGFLRRGNSTVFTAIERKHLHHVLAVIQRKCRLRTKLLVPTAADFMAGYPGEPIEVDVGGAVVFGLNVERAVTLRAPSKDTAVARA